MPKNIRDYTIYEVIELPSSVIENLSIEDKAFYIDIILNKDNSCVNAFAEVVMFVNEKDLDIKQKLIINNIVEFGTTENIKDFLIKNSVNNVFSYTAILEMSFYIEEHNKRTFYEKTESLIFNYNLDFENENEITKSSQEEYRHNWLNNAFSYLDKHYLIEKWHKDYVNIIDNLSYSDFHIKAEMFWLLNMYKNEEVYQILLNNPHYHYLLVGDKKSQNFDLCYKNEKMECIMAPQVNKNCISLIFQYADFSDISKIQKIINDIIYIKSINKLAGIDKLPFTFSTSFSNFNKNNTIKNFIAYYNLYEQYLDDKLNIVDEFFNISGKLRNNSEEDTLDYDLVINTIYKKIKKTNDENKIFKLVNLWLKKLSINNIDMIVDIIKENNFKYKFSYKSDQFYNVEDKIYFKIAYKEDPNNVKPILDKIMPYIRDVKILRRSLIEEFVYLEPRDNRNQVFNEIFDYFCKTKYKKNIFNTDTIEEIIKYLNSYIKFKNYDQSVTGMLDKALYYFNKTEFNIFFKTYESLIIKDKEYENPEIENYKTMFEQNLLLDEIKSENIHSKIKRI